MAFRQTALITLLLSISAVGGFMAYRYYLGDAGRAEQVVGQINASDKRSLPETRPEFILNDPEGNPVSSALWVGKPLAVNFWATWCAPCRREIPMLKSLYTENRERGLQLIGVAIDFPQDVAAYARNMDIKYPLLVGYEDAIPVGEGFGMELLVLPGTVFSLADGRIFYRHVGELHAEQAETVLELMWQVEDGELELSEATEELARRLPEKS